VSVEALPNPCFDSLSYDGTLLSVTNHTERSISFSISGKSGPPFALHPWVFEVVAEDPAAPDAQFDVIVLEHYFPPDSEVKLGPGDQTQFRAYTAAPPSSTYGGLVRLRVVDTHGISHQSEAVPVCPAPN
jgi:hypothetical protein